MKSQKDIKTAVDRTAKALEVKPSVGRMTKKASAKLVNGLTCEMSEGDFTFTTDMPENVGGNGSALGPGAFGRMSLASCLAIGYGMWLAREEMPYEDIQVEVEGDSDFSGILGVDDAISPRHEELRVQVSVVSSCDHSDVERVLDMADRYSPVLNLITQPVPVKRELKLTASVAPVATVS